MNRIYRALWQGSLAMGLLLIPGGLGAPGAGSSTPVHQRAARHAQVGLPTILAAGSGRSMALVADGFDYPLGSDGAYVTCPDSKADASCYWICRGFQESVNPQCQKIGYGDHLGEDCTIPAGQSAGSFTIDTRVTTTTQDVMITARANGVSKSVRLTVTPQP